MESPTQTIEQLQKRHADLNKRKIQAETQRDSAKKQLDDLKADAVRKYGTDDVAKLKEQLNAGTLKEIFITGTAATVMKIQGFGHNGNYFEVLDQGDSEVSDSIKNWLDAVRLGESEDVFKWNESV